MNIAFFEFNQSLWHLGVAFEVAQVELAKKNRVFFNLLAHEVKENSRNKYVPNFHTFNKYLYPEPKIGKRLKSIYAEKFIFCDSYNKRFDMLKLNEELKTNSEAAAKIDLIDEIKGIVYDPNKYKNLIKRKSQAYVETFKHTEFFIQSNDIEKVYTYNGRFLHERAVWEACKTLGVACNFHEKVESTRGNSYWIFKNGVHDSQERSEAINSFWESSKMSVDAKIKIAENWLKKRKSGITQKFTQYQVSKLIPDYPGKKIALFLHSSNDELIASGLSGSGSWGDQQSIIIKVEEILSKIPDVQLIVRMHPNLLSKNLSEQEYWTEFTKLLKCEIISPGEKFDTYQLIKEALFVITCGSTTGIEASLMHKPSILIGQALHEPLGATINVKSEDELNSVISKIISKQVDISEYVTQANKYAFWYSEAGINFKFNKILGDVMSQDPILEVVGIRLSYNPTFKLGFKMYKYIVNLKYKSNLQHRISNKFKKKLMVELTNKSHRYE